MAFKIDFTRLPAAAPLTGSPKQIEWAERIRTTALANVRDFILAQVQEGETAGTDPAKIKEYANKVYRLYQILLRKPTAAWWIDHRSLEASGVLWLAAAEK